MSRYGYSSNNKGFRKRRRKTFTNSRRGSVRIQTNKKVTEANIELQKLREQLIRDRINHSKYTNEEKEEIYEALVSVYAGDELKSSEEKLEEIKKKRKIDTTSSTKSNYHRISTPGSWYVQAEDSKNNRTNTSKQRKGINSKHGRNVLVRRSKFKRPGGKDGDTIGN